MAIIIIVALIKAIRFKTRQKFDRFLTEAKKSGVKRSLLDKSKQVKARTYLPGANAYAFKDDEVRDRVYFGGVFALLILTP